VKAVKFSPGVFSVRTHTHYGNNEVLSFPQYTLQSDEQVIVEFVDETNTTDTGMKAGNNGFSVRDGTTSTQMAGFLSRPVRISTFTWSEADIPSIKTTINPWYLWANNPYIRNKLNNYSFIRGNLKIRFQISVSPFYYGSMMASYQPLTAFTPSTIINDAGTRYFIPYSQRPHIMIEPQHEDAYTMTLPFIYPGNWLDVQNATAWQVQGTISFLIYSALQSANGVSGSGATIVTYAWLEDVELSGASVGYALQSDEYGEGCVSKPASTIARFASSMSDVPIIGPFAKATSIGASAVSAIASLFGFTNVPVIEDTHPQRPEAFPKLGSSDIAFPVEKLTLDPKNELSVDPRIVGLDSGHDEMSLVSIATRESYLSTASWTTADLTDQILFYSRVNPHLYDNDNGTDALLYMTPSSFIASLFNEWRGDIIFRFKVVCSQYHKGKLRVSFDPTAYTAQNIGNTLTTSNVVYTAIIDIGKTDEVEFRVPYQQATQFLTVRALSTAAEKGWATRTSVPSPYPYNSLYDNGFLTLRVMNTLTAPVSSSSVDVMIFTRAADNIEFANPTAADLSHQLSPFAPQSAEFQDNGEVMSMVLGSASMAPENQYLVHYGENIRSLRQLLRRYEHICTVQQVTTTSMTFNYIDFNKMPPTPGYVTTGPWSANKIVGAGTSNYNFTQFSFLSYISPAFLVYRGSTNWSFNVHSATTGVNFKSLRVVKNNVSANNFGPRTVNYAAANANKGAWGAMTYNHPGSCSSALTNQLTQSGLNVQCPNYSKYKFQSTNPLNANTGVFYDGSNLDAFTLENTYAQGGSAIVIDTDIYCAAGTDFSLHFFLNVPTLYVYRSVPTPV
jgi:hypothetical protein